MLTYAAVALLIAVVGTVVAVLGIDSKRPEKDSGHFLDTLRQWQGLVGSMLGLISAAGILVLGQALQANEAQQKADAAAHAIGLGLALEADRIAGGLKTGSDIGKTLKFEDIDLVKECQAYADALQRALPAETPVYKSVLGNLTEFGDNNLAIFVRFYGFYAELQRELGIQRSADCVDNAAPTLKYMATRQNSGLEFYRIIAETYLPGMSIVPGQASGAGDDKPAS